MFMFYRIDAGVRQQLVVICFRMSVYCFLLYVTDCVNELFYQTHVDHLFCSGCCCVTNQDIASDS